MDNFRFSHLPDNLKIQGVKSLYRRIDGSAWSINLVFAPKQDKSSLRLSNAPILARQRIIKPTESYERAGLQQAFRIGNTKDWAVEKIASFPGYQDKKYVSDKEQYCFCFTIDNGWKIYLPQFELARALFFHDAYLSRASLVNGCLAEEFDVQWIDGQIQINVLASGNYHLSYFNESASRRFLSWVLLDEAARRSFESISQRELLEGYEPKGSNYRFWDFSFNPPPLQNTRLVVNGWKDTETKSMFVYEIHAITDIPADIPSEISFYHPKFKQSVSGSGSGGSIAGAERPNEHNLHDDEATDFEKPGVTIEAIAVEVGFANAFKTNRVTEKQQLASIGVADESVADEASIDVSADESDISGALPSAQWDTLDDQTDDVHLYLNKFDSFFEMLNALQERHNCRVDKYPLRKLPKISKCKKHLLSTDGNPRCLAVVRLMMGDNIYHILEVDTSDAEKPLSTKLIKLKRDEALEFSLENIEEQLLRGSLRWPNKIFDQLCGAENHQNIPHPQSKTEGVIDPADINGWADRLFNRIV